MAFNPNPRVLEITPNDESPPVNYFYATLMDIPVSEMDKVFTFLPVTNGIANYSWSGTFEDNPEEWTTVILPQLPSSLGTNRVVTVTVEDSKKVKKDLKGLSHPCEPPARHDCLDCGARIPLRRTFSELQASGHNVQLIRKVAND